MSYNPIGNPEIDADSPITESLLARLRDNPLGMFAGSAGAPRLQTGGINDQAVTEAKIADPVHELKLRVNAHGSNDGAQRLVGGLWLNWCLIYEIDADTQESVTWVHPYTLQVFFCIASLNKLGENLGDDTHSTMQVYNQSLTGATVKMEQFIEPNNLTSNAYIIALGV